MPDQVVSSPGEELRAMGEGVIALLMERGEAEADKVLTIHSVRGYSDVCLSCHSPKDPCNWFEWAAEAKRRIATERHNAK
ncbi:hypothetical protein GCM10023321_80520 [Pseudonocardia eucalypti]|uniref:Uncharacterized protein n=1 Tax=Pseudonocardia eucalypti TaxID=648755 RepID=A0ABP9RCI0_9PSEU|nr:hypothetical protein [Pseudonocardia eucalypti]